MNAIRPQFNHLIAELEKAGIEVKRHEPLASYTTMGVGGEAQALITAGSAQELKTALRLCSEYDVPRLVIGKGSNLIISDSGYSGLVILNNSCQYEIKGLAPQQDFEPSAHRYQKTGEEMTGVNDFLEQVNAGERMIIQADSGWRVAALAKQLYPHGLVGLEWFAGIPATLGGAVYMNMHGGPLFMGDLVSIAMVFDGREEQILTRGQLAFDYDYSILHQTGETVLAVELLLWKGDAEKAAPFGKEWAREKSFQPRRSAGCIFQNLAPEDQKRLGLPTSSIGYLVDKVLGLKGERRGDAVISPNHAAFIENLGQASAADVYALFRLIKHTAREKLGLSLRPEVQFIGEFKQD